MSSCALSAMRSKPFWSAKTRDDADHWLRQIFGGQPELFQQVLLADVLAAEVFRGIFCGDDFVFLRAPERVVHSVEDADQAVGAAANHAVKSIAIFARLNFLRVFAANGGQIIGEDQAAFEELTLPKNSMPPG